MKHKCLTYWGNQSAALAGRLDLGDAARPGGGWAARLSQQHVHAALILLEKRLRVAGGRNHLKLKRLPRWRKGQVRVHGLLQATCHLIGALEGDRLSLSSGAHSPNKNRWHLTGDPDPDSIDEMRNVLWPKIRNALGG